MSDPASMKFNQEIQRYLKHWRTLGREFNEEERMLISLCQSLRSRGMPDLDLASFECWCQSFANIAPNTMRMRQRIVRNFCLYRQRTNPGCFVPDIHRFARPVPYCSPVVFGNTEVAGMLAAIKTIRPAPSSPLRLDVLRLAVVLLYTAGLRRGELLHLTLADADSADGILRIRESKFHKSRLIPLSSDARRELRTYLRRRLAPPLSVNPDSPLLCHGADGLRAYTGAGLDRGIHQLFRAADVHDTDGREPRIHDFRHNFALQALLRWYKEGADVQSCLPKLAMYMGHVSIVSTAYYLKWIPAIAEAASTRFECQFGHLIDGGEK